MRILGISCLYHDSAAALIDDGEIVGAAQEERFTRIKHDSQFPEHAISYCLKAAGISMEEVDYVAFYDKPFLKFERLLETYLSFVPKGFKHVYWTITLKYLGDQKLNLSWKEFFNIYKKFIGESFYAGLSIVPEEKILKNFNEIRKYNPNYIKCSYCKTKSPCIKLNKKYTCKNAYDVQPRLIQLKANHRNSEYVKILTEKFAKMIDEINYKYK